MGLIALYSFLIVCTASLVSSVDPRKEKSALQDTCLPQRSIHDCSFSADTFYTDPTSDLLLMDGSGMYLMPSFSVNTDSTYPNVLPLVTSEDVSTTHVDFTLMTTDVLRQVVYAYDQSRKVIIRFPLIKDGKFETILRVPGRLTGLAVDWSSGNLFLSDTERRTISISTSDGLFSKILLSDYLSSPGVIAIHQKRKIIVWVEHRTDAIKMATLDGSNVRTIVKDACFVRAITIDETREILYYYAERINQIVQLRNWYTDEKLKCALVPKVVHFIEEMHFINGYLAILQRQSGKKFLRGIPADISYSTKKRRGEVQSIGLNSSKVEGEKVAGKCAKENGGCEQICIDINKKSVKCICGTGFKKQSKKCVRDSAPALFDGLIVADQIMARLYHVNISIYSKGHPYVIPVIGLKQPYAVTYDGNKVYWSDLELGMISRAHLNGSHQEVIYAEKEIYVTDLEMDIGTGSLYFAEYGRGKLGIINTFSVEFVRYIMRSPDYKPFGLALQYRNGRKEHYEGMLYVSSHGVLPRLKYYLLDGSGESNVTLKDNPINPRGMTIYHQEFYWIDAYNGIINRLTGQDRSQTVVVSPEWDLYDIAVDYFSLYVSDGRSKSVIRLSREGTVREELGRDVFERPTGLHIIIPTHRKVIKSCSVSCNGVCVWLPGSDNTCLHNVTYRHIDTTEHGLCIVPTVKNGIVVDNMEGALVVSGTVLSIDCLPGHRKRHNSGPMVCRRGNWSNIPDCIIDYEIHGDLKTKGWVIFVQPGEYTFYKYSFMPRLRVILIGGGGGGYDINNTKVTYLGQAGDGGDSIFGDLKAFGGAGGRNDSGGIGGKGQKAHGGDGTWNVTCSRGGDSGEDYCRYLFGRNLTNYCGIGGHSESCCDDVLNIAYKDKCSRKSSDYVPLYYSRIRCSCHGNGPRGGLYGGGAAGSGGGGGGGGGYTCDRVKKSGSGAIPVTVGQGGEPSYSPAGSGLVLVMWGTEDPCDEDVVTESCQMSKKCS